MRHLEHDHLPTAVALDVYTAVPERLAKVLAVESALWGRASSDDGCVAEDPNYHVVERVGLQLKRAGLDALHCGELVADVTIEVDLQILVRCGRRDCLDVLTHASLDTI